VSQTGIYLIRNEINGKVYVGKSRWLRHRFRQHRSKLNLGKHPNAHLQAAWNLYGAERFTFQVLEHLPEGDLLLLAQREAHWSATFQATDPASGYNLTQVTPETTEVRSLESRRKQSVALTGRKLSAVHRQRMSAAQRGRKLTAQTKARLSVRAKGRVFSDEHRQHLREQRLGRKQSPEAVEKTAAAHRGQQRSDETRAKQSAALVGRPLAESTKEKLRASHQGKTLTDACKAKMSASRKGKSPTKLTDQDRAEIVRRYQAGERRADLAAEFSVRPNYVSMLAGKAQQAAKYGTEVIGIDEMWDRLGGKP
jgi:group I intron endonuclease